MSSLRYSGSVPAFQPVPAVCQDQRVFFSRSRRSLSTSCATLILNASTLSLFISQKPGVCPGRPPGPLFDTTLLGLIPAHDGCVKRAVFGPCFSLRALGALCGDPLFVIPSRPQATESTALRPGGPAATAHIRCRTFRS